MQILFRGEATTTATTTTITTIILQPSKENVAMKKCM